VPVATFTLAVDRQYKTQTGEREADFVPIVVWKKSAENCANYLGKGRLCAVEGRLQVRSYETKDGERRWITEVVASSVQFLDWAKDGTRGQPETAAEDVGDINLDDLPF
jgi:single-strand DNA-binding protein